jgi:hypothetical protein
MECSWVPNFAVPKLTKSINYGGASGDQPLNAQFTWDDQLVVEGVQVAHVCYVSTPVLHGSKNYSQSSVAWLLSI